MYDKTPQRRPTLEESVWIDYKKTGSYSSKGEWRTGKIIGVSHDNSEVLVRLNEPKHLPANTDYQTELSKTKVVDVMFADEAADGTSVDENPFD